MTPNDFVHNMIVALTARVEALERQTTGEIDDQPPELVPLNYPDVEVYEETPNDFVHNMIVALTARVEALERQTTAEIDDQPPDVEVYQETR